MADREANTAPQDASHSDPEAYARRQNIEAAGAVEACFIGTIRETSTR